ncbi:MAG: T9SS type A sorting domain-containing protein [Flavobacteriales bacterium]|nr:T9SS type A sorting domain-containing protein [Flavobacteriales bacterium]
MLALSALAFALPASAQYSYTTLGATYNQDFSALGTANINVAGGNLNLHNAGVNGWFYIESNGNTQMDAGTGTGNAGSTYHFGPAGNTERAIGGLRSGSNTPMFGFYLVNNTGQTINNIAIAYTGETWRIGTAARADKLDFQYSLDATSLSTGTWVDADALDYVNGAGPTGNGSLQHSANLSSTITGLTLLNGESIYLRWNDVDASGADDGMAVDDFSLTATAAATITVDAGAFLGDFGNVTLGASSASSSFDISGSSLSADLIITPPTGFEIRTGAAPFGTAPINLGNGTVPVTTIDVRFTPLAATAYADNVVCSSTGATDVNLPVTGTGVSVSAPVQLAITSINGGGNVIQNTPFSITVEAQDAGAVAQDVLADTDVDITLFFGFGSLGGTLSGTILAGTNSVVISGLTYDIPDFGIQLDATVSNGDPLASAQSDPFDVLGEPQDLSFANVPFSGLLNQAVSTFNVEVLRFDATVATEYNGAVTIGVLSGPGNISGTLVQNAVNGVASFNDIAFDAVGSYILTASASALNSGSSPLIQITDVPVLTELIFPQYAVNGGTAGTRLQYVCRVQLDNLVPNSIYRYFTGGSTSPSLNLGTPAGNFYTINNTPDAAGYITGQTSSKSMNGLLMSGDEFTTSGRFGEFTTDGSGSYTGWFSMVPTGNAVFADGSAIYFYIDLNNGNGGTTVATEVRSTNTITMVIPTGSARAVYGESGASPENMIFLYDNTAGSGRPLYGTWAEDDGITTNYATWYAGNVEAQAGRWGAYIPTDLANGVRRIEQRDVATGALVGCPGLSADGTWTGAGSTVNPAAGITPIAFTSGDAGFPAAATWYADLEGDGLGDPNDTQVACEAPVDYIADNSDLCPLLQGTVGSACDDLDAGTINDVIQPGCVCAGQNTDCEGTPNGTALPGTPCDDEDAATGNDTWDNSCMCIGELIDCEGVIGGTDLPGTPCDDGDANTGNDTWSPSCVCAGELLDCEGVPGGSATVGTPCDDGSTATINDVYQGDCSCAGDPIQFTAGNIVVLQAGNGTGSLVNTGNPVVLREFNAMGTNTVSVELPSSGANPLVVGGTASTEGLLSRSEDKAKLIFSGYVQELPGAASLSASTASAVNRGIGSVDADAQFALEATSSTAFSSGSIRGAASQGTDFWSAGANTGIAYFGPGAPATVSTTLTNCRAMEVHDGQLYFSSGSGASRGVWAVGTGTPTTSGQTSTVVVNAGGSASPYEFQFNAATTICYIADDRTFATGGGVQRWDFDGSVWNLSYTLAVDGTTGARGLDVDFSGADPVVYATTTDSPNRLVRVVDTGAGSVGATIATAPTNTAFRGVSLSPEAGCLADSDNDGICDIDDLCPLAVDGIANFDTNTCGCELGYYQETTTIGPNTVITGCTICPPGSYCPDGVAAIPCPAGEFMGMAGASVCQPCAAGYYNPNVGMTECLACAPGFFNPSVGMTSCQACAAGTFNPVEAATECQSCAPGSFSGTAGAVSCTLCEANTYNPDFGATECLACASGESSGVGATACTPIVGCTTDIDIIFQPDGVSDIGWELRAQGSNALLQSGNGVYPASPGYSLATCLPDGCFYLVVTDDGGDGITGGGYQLRVNSSGRLIDNLRDAFGNGGFTAGSVSQIANGEGFCLPLGQDRLIFTSCDKLDWRTGPCNAEYVYANDNALVTAEYGVSNATSGYQMWWFDPNGGYSFRRYQSHSTSNGLPASATRACGFRLNNWSGNQLAQGVLYNVKVRGRVNGTFLPWGPACRLMVDDAAAQCPRTKLMDIPNNQFLSCGEMRDVAANVYVHARPVRRMQANCTYLNANRYQFRFRIPAESFVLVKTASNYFVNTTGLACGKTYEVDVRASFDNGATWCAAGGAGLNDPAWGDVCLLTTSNCFNGGGQSIALQGNGVNGALTMYPNPNRGDQLFINLSQVEEGVSTVSVDIYDGFGKRVAARTIAVQDGFVNTVLELRGELATGMYLVNITAGSTLHTERLVIQP